MTAFVIYRNLFRRFLKKSEDRLLELRVCGGIGIKAHFQKVAQLGMIDRHFRMILIEFALRRIRPAENIVERYVKIVRILAQKLNSRRCLTVFIAVDAGLRRADHVGKF